MKTYLFLLCLYISSLSFGQKSSQKTISETCNCIKMSEQPVMQAPADMCLFNAVNENLAGLKAEFDIKWINDYHVYNEIFDKLESSYNQCPEYVKIIQRSQSIQQIKKGKCLDTDSLGVNQTICKSFQLGKVKVNEMYKSYLPIQVPAGNYSDFKEDCLYDYEENGKFVTKWSLKWLSDCEYERTFVESNNPNTASMFKKEDKFSYRVIGFTKDKRVYCFWQMMGIEYIALIEKVK